LFKTNIKIIWASRFAQKKPPNRWLFLYLASGYSGFALRTSGASSYLRSRFASAWYGFAAACASRTCLLAAPTIPLACAFGAGIGTSCLLYQVCWYQVLENNGLIFMCSAQRCCMQRLYLAQYAFLIIIRISTSILTTRGAQSVPIRTGEARALREG
jgi:hypothetical protein